MSADFYLGNKRIFCSTEVPVGRGSIVTYNGGVPMLKTHLWGHTLVSPGNIVETAVRGTPFRVLHHSRVDYPVW